MNSLAVSTQRQVGPPAPLSPGILEEGGLQKPSVGAMPISAPPTDDANVLEKAIATPVPVSGPAPDELAGEWLAKALGAGLEQDVGANLRVRPASGADTSVCPYDNRSTDCRSGCAVL